MTALEPGRTWAHQLTRTCPVSITVMRPGSGASSRETRMTATWNDADPAAVTLAFTDPWAGKTVEWRIARALLVAPHMPGLAEQKYGQGDVQVRYSGGLTTLWLDNPDGNAVAVFHAEPLIELLTEAAKIVPLGSPEECAIYDAAFDADLLALTGGAA